MINEIRIFNFRCLERLDFLRLRPLTVLIGPNDSGKSAFLAALDLLARNQQAQPSDFWRHQRKPSIEVKLASGQHHLGQQIEALQPVGFYQLPSTGIPMESTGTSEERGAPQLDANGSNLPAVLDYILRQNRKRFEEIVAAVATRVPGLEDIKIPTPDAAHRRIEFVIEKGLKIQGNHASTGVRVITFFVTLAYLPDPPKLILIEEPETGVHPKRLADIVGLLRDITEGKHGTPAQVIMSTHSPYLVDHIDLERDQVLVFSRLQDGSRTAEPADEKRLRAFLDEFMLGEVWFNQGEEGLLKREQ